MKPIIGITCDYDWEKEIIQLKKGYMEGVLRAGGLPLLLPPVPLNEVSGITTDMIAQINGLLLTGGQDVHPRYFGEEPHAAIGRVNPLRDEMEISLCRKAAESGMPVFGICRGVQVLNIAMGGDIFQDMGSQANGKDLICHNQPAPKWFGFHDVNIKEGSRLHRILGTSRISANSFHHQAVCHPAPYFKAVAHTGDGIIEGIEFSGPEFLIGVQWHPECMLDDPNMLCLFEAFVNASGNFKAR